MLSIGTIRLVPHYFLLYSYKTKSHEHTGRALIFLNRFDIFWLFASFPSSYYFLPTNKRVWLYFIASGLNSSLKRKLMHKDFYKVSFSSIIHRKYSEIGVFTT